MKKKSKPMVGVTKRSVKKTNANAAELMNAVVARCIVKKQLVAKDVLGFMSGYGSHAIDYLSVSIMPKVEVWPRADEKIVIHGYFVLPRITDMNGNLNEAWKYWGARCDHLWFVVPINVIRHPKCKIPEGVGAIWLHKNGKFYEMKPIGNLRSSLWSRPLSVDEHCQLMAGILKSTEARIRAAKRGSK